MIGSGPLDRVTVSQALAAGLLLSCYAIPIDTGHAQAQRRLRCSEDPPPQAWEVDSLGLRTGRSTGSSACANTQGAVFTPSSSSCLAAFVLFAVNHGNGQA